MDKFFEILNSDEYKNYVEEKNGVNLEQDCFTIKFIERFMKSEDKTRLFNIDYSVILKQEFLEDGTLIDYYYRPYIVLEKKEKKDNSGKYSLTMTELKQMTHGYQYKSRMLHSIEDYTYVREGAIEGVTGTEMHDFVKIIDAYMFRTEEDIRKDKDIKEKNFLYKFLTEKMRIVDSLFFEFNNQDNDNQIYIRAQDKEKHYSTLGECYDFKIVKIGAQYFYRKNPQQRRDEEMRNL